MARSLLQKLGIKAQSQIFLINAPDNYFELLQEKLPVGIKILRKLEKNVDFIHFFTNSLAELEENILDLQEAIFPNGTLWVSWYKKGSGKQSEVNEDIIRNTALAIKLVDVKVCSIDDNWSGLKLMVRKNLR